MLMATTAAPHRMSVCTLASMAGPGLCSVAPSAAGNGVDHQLEGHGSTSRKTTSNASATNPPVMRRRWPWKCGRTQRSVRRSPDSGFGAGRIPSAPQGRRGFRGAALLAPELCCGGRSRSCQATSCRDASAAVIRESTPSQL